MRSTSKTGGVMDRCTAMVLKLNHSLLRLIWYLSRIWVPNLDIGGQSGGPKGAKEHKKEWKFKLFHIYTWLTWCFHGGALDKKISVRQDFKGAGSKTRPGADQSWFRDHILKKVILSTTTLFGVLCLYSVHEATVSQRQFAVSWEVLSVCFLSLNSNQATGCSFQSRNSQLRLFIHYLSPFVLYRVTGGCSTGHWSRDGVHSGVFITGLTNRDKQPTPTHIQTYR